jgi:hypothetical protein
MIFQELKLVTGEVLIKYTTARLCSESRVQQFKTPTSYSGDPRFKSQPRRQAMLIEVFHVFPRSLQANSGIVP